MPMLSTIPSSHNNNACFGVFSFSGASHFGILAGRLILIKNGQWSGARSPEHIVIPVNYTFFGFLITVLPRHDSKSSGDW